MRRVIVKLDDKEMAGIEAVARARQVDPATLLKIEALKLADSIKPAASAAPADLPIDSNVSADKAAKEQRRLERLALLMRSNGIFAGDPDKPKDGLAYQKELRAEWQ